MIFIRPQRHNAPFGYVTTPEKSGLITFPQQYLGVYTVKSVGNAGPQGPPGVDQNSWFDTIIASCSDEQTPLTAGGPKTTFRAPYPLKMDTPGFEGYVRASLTTEPVGGSIQISITMNGIALFATPITIDAGSRTSVDAAVQSVINPACHEIPDDAEFLVYIDSVPATFPGAGLKVAVTGIKND